MRSTSCETGRRDGIKGSVLEARERRREKLREGGRRGGAAWEVAQ